MYTCGVSKKRDDGDVGIPLKILVLGNWMRVRFGVSAWKSNCLKDGLDGSWLEFD